MMAMPYPQYGLMVNPMAMHQMQGMSQHMAGKMMSSGENQQNSSAQKNQGDGAAPPDAHNK